ncbi:hypothetical protein B0T22DRAFT_442617 [Podospora appendiculata]|uniref:Secreted protein n=1 Tax=Podospora appendiculata TaxID=314037 RepID=A0AAE1CAF4_9PEZI|nr:hypothetical protein B0T22DRAFT_442617 [Podospora appendiculata]
MTKRQDKTRAFSLSRLLRCMAWVHGAACTLYEGQDLIAACKQPHRALAACDFKFKTTAKATFLTCRSCPKSPVFNASTATTSQGLALPADSVWASVCSAVPCIG